MSSAPGNELSETERRNIEQACAALCVDYCEYVDAKDFAALLRVFADDAIFVSPATPDREIRGTGAIVAALSGIPSTLVTQHLAFNIRIHPESADTATGSCRLLIYMADANEPETPEGRKAAPRQIIGVYRDRYVRSASGWRIADRRGRTLLHT
jgi:ketosteroid isomerase-like protein